MTDDDPTPSLTIDDASLTEGDAGTSGLVFSVRLSAPSGRVVTVDFATAGGTAADDAGDEPDYRTTRGTLVFAPGTTTQTISVPVLGDVRAEPDETFVIVLGTLTNAVLARDRSLGTIRNDDAAPVATDDRFASSTTAGGTLTVAAPGVLGNDRDADGDRLTALLVSGPGHGTLTLDPDGLFTYAPAAGFSGDDTFGYRVSDGVNLSDVATVTIAVAPASPPTVVDLVRFGFGDQRTRLVLTFSSPLGPAAASRLSNYRLTSPGRDRVFGTGDDRSIRLRSAVLSPDARTVTLRPRPRLPLRNQRFLLSVNGTPPGGLTGQDGVALDGDRDGRPGGDFVRRFGREAFRLEDTSGPRQALARRLDIPIATVGPSPRVVDAVLTSGVRSGPGHKTRGRHLRS